MTARTRRRRKSIGECQRKARYETRELAEGALFLLRMDGKERGRQEVYHCPHCDRFHFGAERKAS